MEAGFPAGLAEKNCTEAYHKPLVFISVSVIGISIAGSYVLYAKRNINTAT